MMAARKKAEAVVNQVGQDMADTGLKIADQHDTPITQRGPDNGKFDWATAAKADVVREAHRINPGMVKAVDGELSGTADLLKWIKDQHGITDIAGAGNVLRKMPEFEGKLTSTPRTPKVRDYSADVMSALQGFGSKAENVSKLGVFIPQLGEMTKLLQSAGGVAGVKALIGSLARLQSLAQSVGGMESLAGFVECLPVPVEPVAE